MITPLELTGARPRPLKSYVCGQWVEGTGKASTLVHAVTGAEFATASTGGIDMKRVVEHARTVGGPKLRAMTFHQRALMLKALAKHLMEKKDEFYRVSAATGATKRGRGGEERPDCGDPGNPSGLDARHAAGAAEGAGSARH